MRIIAGRAGGITIKAPPSGTRPTSDRVREAVFSMLAEQVPDSRVLDLFAGSGAFGVEALSRGAASAHFVEQHGPACSVIEENLHKARLHVAATVLKSEVFAALRRFAETGKTFDLVFADPPYAKKPGDPDLAARLLADENFPMVLAPHGWLLLETMVTKHPARAIIGWHVVRDRSYGSTRVLLLQRTPHAEIPGPAAT